MFADTDIPLEILVIGEVSMVGNEGIKSRTFYIPGIYRFDIRVSFFGNHESKLQSKMSSKNSMVKVIWINFNNQTSPSPFTLTTHTIRCPSVGVCYDYGLIPLRFRDRLYVSANTLLDVGNDFKIMFSLIKAYSV